MINLFWPYVPDETIESISEILRSKWIAQGQKTIQFENNFSSIFNVKYPVSVNSGTSALEIAFDLINLKKGDEVITTPLTCSATNIPLLHKKVKIVWADILKDTLCIDPADVERKITERTKAIVQVHLGGVKAEVGCVEGIPVISDACQSLGIFSGDYTCCSFQAIKHITTGDGGMLVCPDEETYRKAQLMRWFGIDRFRKIPNTYEAYRTRMMCFDIEVLGYKKQMNDIAATMGIVGLNHYGEVVTYRKRLFDLYKKLLGGIDGLKIIDGKENVYWLCTLLVERRDDFAKMLFDAGVETNVVQVRNDKYSIFKTAKRVELPVMDEVENKYISVPIGMHISEENVNYICNKIKGGW